jgi:DNA invertase Pin-like site-specific DNA recombinase
MAAKHKGQRVGYIRVSTVDQNTERQLDGIDLDKTFTDKASGKDANRPKLQAALRYVREGDTLYVHSLDRLGRNVDDLRRMVSDLTGRGITVVFVKNSLTFTGDKRDPMATLMLTMLGAFAEFERSLLRERQAEGIAIAKAKGVYKGRAKALTAEEAQELVALARDGMAKAELARTYAISRETVYQYLRAHA